MKKRILICISLLLVVICLIGVYVAQSSKIVGEEGLIAKARKEITNLAEVETIEMTIEEQYEIYEKEGLSKNEIIKKEKGFENNCFGCGNSPYCWCLCICECTRWQSDFKVGCNQHCRETSGR